MSDGVAELLDAVGLVNERTKDRSIAMQELADQQRQAAQEQDDALVKSAASDKIVASAKMIADKKAEQQTIDGATRLGTNVEEGSSILGALEDDWRTASLNAIDKQKKLESDLSINFFQHPGAFIKAQIGMEQTVKQADAAVAHRNNAAQALAQAQQNTQSINVISNTLRKTVTDATMEATLDKVDATLQGQRAALRIQNAGIQMDSLKALGQMDASQINNLATGVGAKNQQAQLQISREHLALAQRNADMAWTEFQQKMKDKKATNDDMEFIAKMAVDGAASLGVDISGLGSSKIISLMNMKDTNIMKYFNIGSQARTTGKGMLANNAGEAAEVIASTHAPLRPEQSEVKKLLNSSWNEAHNPNAGYDVSKKDQVIAGASKIATQIATKMQNNIDPKDGTNIYAAPPLDAVMKTPGLQNTAWYKVVMQKQMEAGGLKEFNSDQLFSLTAKAVKDGTLSFKDATTGLQTAHSTAVLINNATKNYEGFGLPKQTTFKLKLPNVYGVERAYDLVTPQSVQQLLNNKLNEDRVYKVDATNPFRY